MIDLIKKLCCASGIPGDEKQAIKVSFEEISKYADTHVDKNGNVIAQMGNKNSDLHIMLDAHIDQVGFIVTDIDKNGFIKFSACGGIDSRILPAMRVKILGKSVITGVIGSMPPHLTKSKDEQICDISDLFIDTGMDKKALSKVVSLGDRIVFAQEPEVLLNNRIASPALDDRAGVACLIECAKILSKSNLKCKLSIVFSVQEETGLLGARTAAYKINPSEAVLVDVSFAHQPMLQRDNCAHISKGPMIGIAPILNKSMYQKFISIADNKNIPYQLEVMSGTTSTNADAVTITRCGIPCSLISIPLRYMHSPTEVIDLIDVKNSAVLISEYILKRGEK